MRDERYHKIIELMEKRNMKEESIQTLIVMIEHDFSDKDISELIEALETGKLENDKAIQNYINETILNNFQKNRIKEFEEVKKKYKKDSPIYMDYLLEEFIYRDMILNTIILNILVNKKNNKVFVRWLEKQQKPVKDITAIKKAIEISSNNYTNKIKYKNKLIDKIINKILEIDAERIFSKKEYEYIIDLLEDDYQRKYLYNFLMNEEIRRGKGTGYIKNFIMNLISVPYYMEYGELEEQMKIDEKIDSYGTKLHNKLTNYVKKGTIDKKNVSDIYRNLMPGRNYYLLYNYLTACENKGEEITKQLIFSGFLKAYDGLLYQKYELLNWLGLEFSLNNELNKKILSRYIDSNLSKIIKTQNYLYKNSSTGLLQFVRKYKSEKDETFEEQAVNTYINLPNETIWELYVQRKFNEFGEYLISDNKEEKTKTSFLLHLVNDELVKVEEVNKLQISCIASKVYIYKEEKSKYFKKNLPPIGNILPAAIINIYEDNPDLSYIRGRVIDNNWRLITFIENQSNVFCTKVDTVYGELEICYGEDSINTNENNSIEQIKPGDIIEAIVYMAGDPYLESLPVKK